MASVIDDIKHFADEKCRIRLSTGECFTITSVAVLQYSLSVGRELDGEDLESLRALATKTSCRERAMRILSAVPMSERGLYRRLIEKGESEAESADTVAWLKSIGFLNDQEYAAMLVRHCAGKGYGARRIRDELYKKCVPREIWDEAIENNLPQQDDTLDALLRRKIKSEHPDRAEIKRASDAMLRRGFSWSEIRAALERLLNEEE